jgi:hypothetical protein
MSIINLDNLSKSENQLFNSIADDIKYAYNELIIKLSNNHISNINWIVGSIASRNKYQSKLFERCCKLVLTIKLIEINYNITKIELKDYALADILNKYMSTHNKDIDVILNEKFQGYVWRITRPYRQFIIGFYQYFWRFIKRKKSYISHLKNNDNEITLLDTFVLNSTPGAGGTISNNKYNDRYYTGIFNYLSSSESKNIYYLPTIVGYLNPASTFSMIRNCKDQFIVPDDFMSLSDYFNILSHPFNLLKIKVPNILFKGINIKSLIKQEIFHTCSDQISFLGVFNYIFPYRLKSHRIKIHLLVDWFENQVIDRGLQVGFHSFLPQVKTIGYQGYIISPALHLYVFPNKTEILSRAIPDKIAVIGNGLLSQIKMFSVDLNVVTSPAFRFQKLWDKRKKYPSRHHFTILVSLPISLPHSKMILEKMVIINNKHYKTKNNYRMIIKPHPTYTVDIIKSLVEYNWDKIYKFSSGEFNDILEESDLVITNASSTAVESLARAVPVIIIGEENGILQNPIPTDINKEMWHVCYTHLDIEKSIIKFSNKKSKINFENEAFKIREKYFNQVNRDSVKKFLNLN